MAQQPFANRWYTLLRFHGAPSNLTAVAQMTTPAAARDLQVELVLCAVPFPSAAGRLLLA
jgi:hypothetical protein